MKSKGTRNNLIFLLILIGLIAVMTPFAEDILSFVFEHWIFFALGLIALAAVAFLFRGKSSGRVARGVLFLSIGGLIGSVAAIFALGALGINLDYKVAEQLSAEQAKSNFGIVTNGTIAESAEYVFYLEPPTQPGPEAAGPHSLIRRDKDWTDRIKLTDSPINYFIIDENWIYYVDPMESSHLMRMDHSGGQVQLLADDRVERCLVAGDRLFYNTVDAIYQIQIDGSGKTKVLDDSGWPSKLTQDGWLYYQTSLHKLSRVKTDGTQSEEVVSQMDGFHVADDALYFFKLAAMDQGMAQDMDIFRQGFAAKEAEKVTTVENVHFAKYNQGSLYYQRGTDKGRIDKGVYQAAPDGANAKKINKLAIWQFNDMLGDWIYFLQYSGKQYRVKLDGSIGVLFE